MITTRKYVLIKNCNFELFSGIVGGSILFDNIFGTTIVENNNFTLTEEYQGVSEYIILAR